MSDSVVIPASDEFAAMTPERRWQARMRSAATGLFPPAAPAPVRARSAALAAVAVGAATAGGLARQRGAGALHTIYAEDGNIFLRDALRFSYGRALRTPYMGYVHLVPRTIAVAASWVPLRDAPVVFSGTGALVVALLAALLYRATANHIPSRRLRVLLAAAVVALPLGQLEVLNTAANLHWYLLPMCFWLLVAVPATRWETALCAAVIFAAAMSDPNTLLLVPVAALRIVALRGGWARLPAWSLGAGLGLQAVLSALGGAHRQLHPTLNVVRVGGWFTIDVVARVWFGSRLVGPNHGVRAVALTAVALALTGLLGWWVWARADSGRRLVFVAAAGSAIALYVVPVMITGDSPPRYAVPPAIVLLGLIVMVLGRADVPGRWWRVGLVGWLLVVWAVDLPVRNDRSRGPEWDRALAAAARVCEATGQRTVSVAIPPVGWTADLPCSSVIATVAATGPGARSPATAASRS